MQIIIDGKKAVIKKGSSFEYVAENRYFTGSDSYTFSITLPLRDCKENREIFGDITRMDVVKSRVEFDCEIFDRDFLEKGIVTITDINESEVKVQFLQGKSVANFQEDLDDVYINELELGNAGRYLANDYSVASMMRSIDAGANWVALPFVNNSSGNLLNELESNGNGGYVWKNRRTTFSLVDGEWKDPDGLTFQPYLIYILNKVCDAIGFSYDFTDLANSDYRHLIICSVLPYTWAPLFCDDEMTFDYFWENLRQSDDAATEVWSWMYLTTYQSIHWQHSLPHWSVTKFFEQVGYLVGGTFDIDVDKKRITFGFNRALLSAAGSVMLDKVVDMYSLEVDDEEDDQYIDNRVFEYKDGGYDRWSTLSCTWFIQSHPEMIEEVSTLSDLFTLLDECKKMTISDMNNHSYGGKNEKFRKVYYVSSIGTYFMLYNYKSEGINGSDSAFQYYMVPKSVNVFGGKPADEDASTTQLEIVPVRIDNLSIQLGDCIFIDVPTSDELEKYSKDDGEPHQPTPYAVVKAGKNGQTKEYYSTIQVAFWNGTDYFYPYCPRPIVDRIETFVMPGNSSVGQNEPVWGSMSLPFSLRLFDEMGSLNNTIYPIESKMKYSVKFLSKGIPNPRAIFYIHGQRYICKKLTVTFSENGRSELIKGEFYKIRT